MSREKKAEIIEMLQGEMSKCIIGILTDYRGLSNLEITTLRRRLQEKGSQYKVVKNTLARFAAERAGREDLVSSFEGPVAIAFSYDSLSEAAKVIADYIRTSGASISIKGGFLANRVLTTADVMNLSTLPSREVLLARVVGGMKSPLWSLAGCLANPLRGFIGVLQARISQLEGA
jgi:large subunit ribosomal protein L10